MWQPPTETNLTRLRVMSKNNVDGASEGGLPPRPGSASSILDEALLCLTILEQCLRKGVLPRPCSPFGRKLTELLNQAGIRDKKRRVPKRHKIGKLQDEMVTALRIVHAWATVHDGVALNPQDVTKLTAKALAAYDAATIQIGQNARAMTPGVNEESLK